MSTQTTTETETQSNSQPHAQSVPNSPIHHVYTPQGHWRMNSNEPSSPAGFNTPGQPLGSMPNRDPPPHINQQRSVSGPTNVPRPARSPHGWAIQPIRNPPNSPSITTYNPERMLAAELHNAIIAGENQAGNPFDPLPAYHRESDSQPLQSSMIRDIPDIPTRQSPPAYNLSPRANSVPISLPESVSDIQDQSINRQQTLSGPGYLGPANAESTPWFGRVRNRRPDTEDPRGYETETDIDKSILLRSMGVIDPAMERRCH